MRWAILGGVMVAVTLAVLSLGAIAARPPQITVREPPPPLASPVQTSELRFDSDHAARVWARLIGRATHEYTFQASRGQSIAFAVDSDLARTFSISILPPGVDRALYTNLLDGNTEWEGVAPGDGTYTVRVAFLRSDARKAGRADYELGVIVR